MASFTKVSSYRSGAPRFGTKGHVEKWDNSVKVSYLSPEELEEYRSGRKGGRRMVTHEDYLALEKQGLTKKEIAKKLDISVPTLYKRLEVWKQQPLKNESKNAQEPQEQKEKATESESEQKDKSVELVALIATLKAQLVDKDQKVSELEKNNQDREFAYEALKHSHEKLISQYSALQAVVPDNDLEKMQKVIDEYRVQAKDLQDKLQETEDNLQEVLGTNENLHKEILIMNESVIRSTELLNGASNEIESITKKYNNLLREVEPLRQLALMKLQQDVSA
ncbi:hypothetical protein M3172_08900 [Mesobacillus subterraneus]|uniref:hypothetical protein n=1 Tax=Mesobacillus subterraneus TaxID=285983 RepID=UPI00203BA9D2|nr:hypothetical protein [Mesobacillus subterraneus]MCM3573312.1 hypothetical protein [Mesobacillus subterraneus]